VPSDPKWKAGIAVLGYGNLSAITGRLHLGEHASTSAETATKGSLKQIGPAWFSVIHFSLELIVESVSYLGLV